MTWAWQFTVAGAGGGPVLNNTNGVAGTRPNCKKIMPIRVPLDNFGSVI